MNQLTDTLKKNKIEAKLDKDVEIDLRTNDAFDINQVLIIFSIVGVTIGTAVGNNANELLKNVTLNIINPILDIIFSGSINNGFMTLNIKNNNIYIGKFLYQLIGFLVTLAIIYLILKYLLRDLVKDSIKNKKISSTTEKKQNTEIINKLDDINNTLKSRPYGVTHN